jgi:hypothetical protein
LSSVAQLLHDELARGVRHVERQLLGIREPVLPRRFCRFVAPSPVRAALHDRAHHVGVLGEELIQLAHVERVAPHPFDFLARQELAGRRVPQDLGDRVHAREFPRIASVPRADTLVPFRGRQRREQLLTLAQFRLELGVVDRVVAVAGVAVCAVRRCGVGVAVGPCVSAAAGGCSVGGATSTGRRASPAAGAVGRRVARGE